MMCPTRLLAVILAILVSTCIAAPSAQNITKIHSGVVALDDENAKESSGGQPETITNEKLCNSKDTELDCDQTEYSEYMKCLDTKRTIRKKRQATCPIANSLISPTNVTEAENATQVQSVLSECEFERNKCVVGCQGDSTCVFGCQSCGDENPINCSNEYHNCVANCVSGQVCETTCKSLCPGAFRPLGYKTVIFQGHDGDRTERVQVPIGIAHNITTIIKLNNYINTTNHINVPTNINNTNINTVHLYTNATEGGRFGLGETKDGACCFAVQPKSCRTSTSGLRCHHRRHRTCGNQCTSRIIHAQKKNTCDRRGKCRSNVSYVPEPTTKCHYANQWPYVSCGSQRGQRSCEGCYDHYSNNNQYYQPSVPRRCMSCYDDGHDVGPRYRQGPYYRPNYYHQPPCYMTGSCFQMGGGYGYYPPPPPPPPPQMYYPMHDPVDNQPGQQEYHEESYADEDQYPGDDGDEYSGYEPAEETHFNEAEWDQIVQKCKVIKMDENTVIIKNCTETDLGDNPYAAVRVADDKDKADSKLTGIPRAAYKTDLDEGQMMAPLPPYYQYAPYNYYYNYPPPPPMAGYYAPPPPYNYYSNAQPRKSHPPADAIRPDYYDNYGSEDGDEPVLEDDFWRHDEERELVEKGFEKVEEKVEREE